MERRGLISLAYRPRRGKTETLSATDGTVLANRTDMAGLIQTCESDWQSNCAYERTRTESKTSRTKVF